MFRFDFPEAMIASSSLSAVGFHAGLFVFYAGGSN